MPVFYFQQYAGRSQKRGQNWLEHNSAVHKDWLPILEAVLTQIEIVPNAGKDIRCPGGILFAYSHGFLAIFSLSSVPYGYTDYNGRLDGIVLNVLFLKTDTLLHAKSLKNAWHHPVLKSPPVENAEEQILIALDDNTGNSAEEREFFRMAAEHYQDDAVVLYPEKCRLPRYISFFQGKKIENTLYKKIVTEENSQYQKITKKEPFMIKTFACGILTGIALSAGCVWYFGTKMQPSLEKTGKLLEIPLNRLKKDSWGYHLPFIVNIEDIGKGKQQIVVYLQVDGKSSDNGNQIENRSEKNGNKAD